MLSSSPQASRRSAHIDRRPGGVEREVDAIIFGTGFPSRHAGGADQMRVREGKLISDVWEGSPRAYWGPRCRASRTSSCCSGPPGLGHSSMVYMIESQVEHVVPAIEAMERGGASTIEVRPEVHARFNREIDSRLQGTVWDTGGCSSFYLDDDTGRNATLWPDWTWRFRQRAARFDPQCLQRRPSPSRCGHERQARHHHRRSRGIAAAGRGRVPSVAG